MCRALQLYERLGALASKLPVDDREEFAELVVQLAWTGDDTDEARETRDIVKYWRKVNGYA